MTDMTDMTDVDTLLVRVRPGETRIARTTSRSTSRSIAQNTLIDFAVYRPVPSGGLGEVGAVYLARVKKVVPSLNAAFVDLGADRDGFLGIAEARLQAHTGGDAARDGISDHVHEGQAIWVQVLAAAREDKGPKVTRRISITGTYLVLTPNDPGVRISKRLKDKSERERLSEIIKGQGKAIGLELDGCVVRSASKDISADNLVQELQSLSAQWADLQAQAADLTPPQMLTPQILPAVQYVSENGQGEIGEIWVDDPSQAASIEAVVNDVKVGCHSGADIFEAYGIGDGVDQILDRVVPLPSGGSIIIDETSALTAIDVNSGGGRGAQMALDTNLEAVTEAARQMRLRNLAGLIVIDLMAVRGEQAKGRIVNAFKKALEQDPAGPQVLGTTRGGLLEVTRPRRRAPLSHVLCMPCGLCGGAHGLSPLTLGLRALSDVLAEVVSNPGTLPTLTVHPKVLAAIMSDGHMAFTETQSKLGHDLKLIGDDALPLDRWSITAAKGNP